MRPRFLKTVINVLLGLSVLILFLTPFFWTEPVDYLQQAINDNGLLSALAFIAIILIATVVAPVTALPLVPALAPIFGPLQTAIYAVLGWGMGAVIAFLLARHIGRPLLAHLVSLESLTRYESKIPPTLTFWGLVGLRMVLPVDVLSYAIGLVSTISLPTYTAATLIGIVPFALIFSYGGAFLAD